MSCGAASISQAAVAHAQPPSPMKIGQVLMPVPCAGNLDPISLKPFAADSVLQPITNTGSPRAPREGCKQSSGKPPDSFGREPYTPPPRPCAGAVGLIQTLF